MKTNKAIFFDRDGVLIEAEGLDMDAAAGCS